MIGLLIVACVPQEDADSSAGMAVKKKTFSTRADAKQEDLGPVPFCGTAASTTENCKIKFSDKNLETKVKLQMNAPKDVSLKMAKAVTKMTVSNVKVQEVNGLQYFKKLTSLYLYDNQITDLSSIGGLSDLEVLSLYNNQITDISPLQGLTKLKKLYLHNNKISNLGPLANLQDLEELSVYGNNLPPECDSVQKFIGKQAVQDFLANCLKGQEICDDGLDNNKNGKFDCADEACTGMIWGFKNEISVENPFVSTHLCANAKEYRCLSAKPGTSNFEVVTFGQEVIAQDKSLDLSAGFLCTSSGWIECDAKKNGQKVDSSFAKIGDKTALSATTPSTEGEIAGSSICMTNYKKIETWAGCDKDNDINKGLTVGAYTCDGSLWRLTKDVTANFMGKLCSTDAECASPELKCYNLRGNAGLCDYKSGETKTYDAAVQNGLKDKIILYGDKVRIKTVTFKTYLGNGATPDVNVGSITVKGVPIIVATTTTPSEDNTFEFVSLNDKVKKSLDPLTWEDVVLLRKINENEAIGLITSNSFNGYLNKVGAPNYYKGTSTTKTGATSFKVVSPFSDLNILSTDSHVSFVAQEGATQGSYLHTQPINDGGIISIKATDNDVWKRFVIERVI